MGGIENVEDTIKWNHQQIPAMLLYGYQQIQYSPGKSANVFFGFDSTELISALTTPLAPISLQPTETLHSGIRPA